MTKATTTAIGPQTRVNGRIVGDSTVDVFGYVRGEIDLRDTLTVHEEGVVDGDIAADNIIVNGTIRGQLHVRNHLVLGSSARVVATIKTHLFTVEEGATFSGDIETHIGSDESAKPLNYAVGNRRNNRQATSRFGSSTNNFVSRTFNRPSETEAQVEQQVEAVETTEIPREEQSEVYNSYHLEEQVHRAAAQYNAEGASPSQTTTAVMVLEPEDEAQESGVGSEGVPSESESATLYESTSYGDHETSEENVREEVASEEYSSQYVDEHAGKDAAGVGESDEELEEEEYESDSDLSESSESEYEEDEETSDSDDEEDEDLKKKS